MKNKKEKKEKFILYNNFTIDKDGNIAKDKVTEKDREIIYKKIAKRQTRNAIILSLGIFTYFLSISWLLITESYFEKIGNDNGSIIGLLALIALATILVIFQALTKSKDGKIKYQYKNMKFFFISLIFFAISIFIMCGGLINIDSNIRIGISIIFLGITAAFDILHDLTKGTGKLQINIIGEIIILILVFITFGILGVTVEEKFSSKISYEDEYQKNLVVIGDPEDRDVLVQKTDNYWYTFTQKYKTNNYELSVSTKPENLEIVYDEAKDVRIWYLHANDDYALWSEISNEKIKYLYYDRQENQVYILLELDYNDNFKQNYNLALYKDRIYYEVIDYQKSTLYINEYNITTNKEKIIYTLKYNETKDSPCQSINLQGNNLLVSTSINGKQTILSFDLDKAEKESYKLNEINLKENINTIYSISSNKEQYAIYYLENGIEKLGVFNKDGKLIKKIKEFDRNSSISNNQILLQNKELLWIEYNDSNKNITNNYSLEIFNLKVNKSQSLKKVYNFSTHKNKIYTLSYYGNNPKNVRLYKLWK